MTDERQLTANFLDTLRQANRHTEQVEDMLAQTLQVLSKLGNHPPFNLEGVLQQGQATREKLSDYSQQMVGHLMELNQLVETSALITTSLEIERVLREVIDTVIHLTGAERVFLMLIDAEAEVLMESLTVRAARNLEGENITDQGVTFSRGVIQSALESRAAIITTNAQEDERFQQMQSVMRNDLRSIMVIPMVLQRKPVGVLYLDNRLTTAVFHQKSIPVIRAFANQAAIAIENARLFEQVQASLVQTRQEVHRVRIQLDDVKVKKQVSDITDTEYFQELSSMAKNLRNSRAADQATDEQ